MIADEPFTFFFDSDSKSKVLSCLLSLYVTEPVANISFIKSFLGGGLFSNSFILSRRHLLK